MFQSTACGLPSREVRAGTEAETVEECCLRAHSASCLTQHRPTCLRMAPPTTADPACHFPIKTVPHRLVHRPVELGDFLSWASPLGDFTLCQVDSQG